jgi:hypothetical protein
MQFIIALLICTVGLPQPPLAHWGCDYGHGHSQMVGAPDQPFELLAAVAPPRGAPDAQDFESLFGSTGIINIGFCPIYGLVARYKWMVSVRARRAAVCARGALLCVRAGASQPPSAPSLCALQGFDASPFTSTYDTSIIIDAKLANMTEVRRVGAAWSADRARRAGVCWVLVCWPWRRACRVGSAGCWSAGCARCAARAVWVLACGCWSAGRARCAARAVWVCAGLWVLAVCALLTTSPSPIAG